MSTIGDKKAADARTSATELIDQALGAGRSVLSEWDAKALFVAYGIAVPEGTLARGEEEAAAAAARLGGRLAMKAVGAELHHKTELGLVALEIEGAEAAGETYRVLRRRAEDAGLELDGVLVERMVAGNRELMVGMKRDPIFGPVVAFGLGGVLTEALGDVVLALAPVGEAEAAELPGLIRAGRLLDAFRGYPPVDRGALARVIQTIGRIALEHPHVAEIDVNPLLVEGDRPVAADALVVLSIQAPPERAVRAFAPDIRAVLSPESVAIVGASGEVSKWGGSALRNILDGGYSGRVYPVNPKGGVFFGLQVFPSIDDLPEAPDLALLAVSGHQLASVMEQCGRRGVKAAVAITAGFSETGEEGAEAEREIARVATEGRLTLIGPNCMGLISNDRQLHATGFVVLHPVPGTLSFVSHSGNIGTHIVNSCGRRGIGIDKFLSVGNEAQTSALDVVEYLRDDPSTTGIMMYLEGIDDGDRFMEVMRRTTPVKPVVVLRGGLTEFGSKAAASHTGAMAGSAAVFEAAARQAGVVTCANTHEVVDLGACLAYLPLPRGKRIAVITNGGGMGVLAADEIARNGLVLSELPPELVETLDQMLPAFWSRRNPLDLVASAGGDVGPRIVELVARCEAVDAVIVISFLGVPNAGDDVRPTCADGEYAGLSPWETAFLRRVEDVMGETGKPIINVPDTPIRGPLRDFKGRYRPIVIPSPDAAARALAKMEWYRALRLRERGTFDPVEGI